MTNAWHPSDDDLILHFYGECGAEEARRLDAHLADCAFCKSAWAEIDETLHLVDQATVAEPPDGFERVMWAKVQQQLPARERRTPWTIRVLLPMAATAVIAALTGGYLWRLTHRAPEQPAATVASVVPTGASAASATKSTLRERVLLTALDDHLQQAQTLLVELNNAPEDALDFAFERIAADDLVISGRLYRITAWQTGNRQLAQILDDLEGVLVEVARQPDTNRAAELKTVRARIASEDLLFKVRTTTKQIHDRQRDLLKASANE